MKKHISILSAAALAGAMILTGCTKPAEPEEVKEPETEQTETETETLLGGWQPYTEYVELLNEDEKIIFKTAMENLIGVNYSPVQVVATQLVSGTNYAFLASAENVSTEADKGFAIVTIYKNLEGKTAVLAINRLDINDLKVKDNADDPNLLGNWEVTDIGKVAGISAEGENALSKALEGFTGVSLKPIVLLGTQVVSGMNYMFLCRGAATTADPVMNLYITTVYEDTAGKCTITDNQVLDLVHYVTAE